jgi:hypothetical protein
MPEPEASMPKPLTHEEVASLARGHTEIADRIAHERTGAARERTSTHEAQRPSH